MKIVFFGSDSFVLSVLKTLEENFEISAVVTTANSPVANYFKGPVLTPDKLDENFKFQISNFKFNLAVVASYGKIIPQTILDIPEYGFLNIHPSLLPKFRGPSPVTQTILNGDKKTGVTIIKMDEQMDHGPIVATKEISLTGQEILPDLINKLFQLGAELLVKIIPDYVSGKIKLIEQNYSKATYCQRLTRDSGFFDITNPPSFKILDRMIRAYYPWPGVWCKWKGKIVKLLPGDMLQMEGGKPTSKKVFLNNYPDFPKIV